MNMKPVKFLVSGWNVRPDGSYYIFKVICDFEKAQKYLELMEKRNNKNTKTKIDSIEVIY